MAVQNTDFNMALGAVETTDLSMAFGGHTDYRHQHKPHSWGRITHPDMTLRGNTDHRHQHGLRWLHRPLMSTWPLVATQPMVFFQFSFFLNVDASFVTGIEPRGMHILSKWSVTVLHPKSPSHGSFHLSLPTLSLFFLHFPLTSHIAARPPFYYTFPLLDFETALKITKSSHCSMPTALALLRGMFRIPTDPCHC